MPAVQTQTSERLTKDAGLLVAMQHAATVNVYPDTDVPRVLDPSHQNTVAIPGDVNFEPSLPFRVARKLSGNGAHVQHVDVNNGNVSVKVLLLNLTKELPAVPLLGPGLADVRNGPVHHIALKPG